MPKLSVIIITKNESAHIVPCLESVRFADEWIVVDSGSVDDTVERARQWGAVVYIYDDWQGFGIQKNRALQHATGEWVLSIDADERVSPGLTEEIQHVMAVPDAAVAYTMPRLSSYCGHFMQHGGWWPDRVLRLFRRESGRFSDRRVHESVQITGHVRKLSGHFIHFTHPTLEGVIDKMNAYSTAGAQIMFERGRSAGVLQAVSHALWSFLRTYIFRAGFLDDPMLVELGTPIQTAPPSILITSDQMCQEYLKLYNAILQNPTGCPLQDLKDAPVVDPSASASHSDSTYLPH